MHTELWRSDVLCPEHMKLSSARLARIESRASSDEGKQNELLLLRS